jgi:hypothetical protein
MAIFSVDGIEVIKGRAASEADNGYIVNAFSSIDVKGFRIDEANVAAFKFAELSEGYNIVVGATKVDKVTGEEKQEKSSKNSGVIGVRVIEEDAVDLDYLKQFKPLPTYSINSTGGCGSIRAFYPIYGMNLGGNASGCLYQTGSSLCNTIQGCSGFAGEQGNQGLAVNLSRTGCCLFADSAFISSGSGIGDWGIQRTNINQYGQLSKTTSLNFDTSTTWGHKVEDKVKEVSFKRSDVITDIEIFYASRESLATYGIDFSNIKQIFSWPSAFEDRKQYCKVPPGYKL